MSVDLPAELHLISMCAGIGGVKSDCVSYIDSDRDDGVLYDPIF